jgi:hypothetical protein
VKNMHKKVLAILLVVLLLGVGYFVFGEKGGFPVTQNGIIKVKLLNALSKQAIANTDVNIYSDNGIRCITTPCDTDGQEWKGMLDNNGVIVIPMEIINEVTNIAATGYEAGRDLVKDSQKISDNDWVMELVAD